MNLLKQLLKVLLALTLGLSTISAFAISSDDTQPLQISSDSFNANYQQGIAIYQGHVIAIQGTRKLSGDKLTLHRNKTGQIDNITIYGKPARYRALPDVGKPMVHAQANTMIFQPQLDLFTLKDNAQIEQNGNISQAPIITYNTVTEVVSSPASNDGRTTMIIQPYSRQQ